MQVAAARQGFAPLRYWDGPGAERHRASEIHKRSKTAAQPVAFFTHPSTRYGTTAVPKHTVCGACAPPGAGALRRPLPSEGRQVLLASPFVLSKIHRTTKPIWAIKNTIHGQPRHGFWHVMEQVANRRRVVASAGPESRRDRPTFPCIVFF